MIYLLLADGFEDIEAITPYDVLKRAGADIITVGVGKKEIKSRCGLVLTCDAEIGDVQPKEADMIILPGGMPGTDNLENSDDVIKLVDYCAENNKIIAAICAAPRILGRKGLLKDKTAVCYPGFEKELGGKISEKGTACDGNFITGRAAGSAMDFALLLVERLYGKEKAEKIREEIIYNG